MYYIATFSGERILCGYSRMKQKANTRIYKYRLNEGGISDQMSIKEIIDPFTGSKNKKA